MAEMNDLIQRIVNAIIRQEGMADVYPNPGNLRAAPWLVNPCIEHGFWKPVSRKQGIAGAAHVVALHIAMGDSLRQLISRWAPPSENDTALYTEHISEWAGIPQVDEPLWKFIC